MTASAQDVSECTSSGQLTLIILHGEMKSDPQTRKSLFYHFHFTSALFCRWKRPLLSMKEQLKFCSQACASAEVTVRVTAAVMNFNMKITWTSPPIPQRTGQDCHAFHRGFLQVSGSNCFWPLVAWIGIEMLSIPKDYKSVVNWIWAATSVLPSSSTICEKVPWALGF